MSNQVFANGMEVSCKQAAGKSICSFPDVCFTPPQTPATPPGVPIPYPNTGMASDTTEGSTTVKISGQEVMLKNKSHFKKSTGDEAGSAPKKGLINSKISGKVYFVAWSMDVKAEGENVVRHLDMTTHNHGSNANDATTWPYLDAAAMGPGGDCEGDVEREKEKCKDCKPYKEDGKDPCDSLSALSKEKPTGDRAAAKPLADKMALEIALDDCLSARRCRLVEGEKGKGDAKCCSGQTGHHLVEASGFANTRPQGASVPRLATFPNSPQSYKANDAPCICAEGTGNSLGGTHELMHVLQKEQVMKLDLVEAGLPLHGGGNTDPCRIWTYKDAKESAIANMKVVFEMSGCSKKCIEAQLDAYHKKSGIDDNTRIKAVPAGPNPDETMNSSQAVAEAKAINKQVLESRLANNNLISGVWG